MDFDLKVKSMLSTIPYTLNEIGCDASLELLTGVGRQYHDLGEPSFRPISRNWDIDLERDLKRSLGRH